MAGLILDAIRETIKGKDIEQKVTDCLQDWEAACSNAVKEMMEQQKSGDDSSRKQFVISLIGNLAWAATVFFPPAAGVAATVSSASTLTKVVSVVGAAVGSNTLGQLMQPNPSVDWSAVGDHLSGLVPKIAANLASVANDWKEKELTFVMYAAFGKRPLTDDVIKETIQELSAPGNAKKMKEFDAWYNSYEGGRILRRLVWELFVFPAPGLAFDNGQLGMKRFLIAKLTDLKKKFDARYKAYWVEASQRYLDYASDLHHAFRTRPFKEWMDLYYPDFHFTVSLDGLPAEFLKAQDQRLREFEFKLSCTGCGERIPVPGAGR